MSIFISQNITMMTPTVFERVKIEDIEGYKENKQFIDEVVQHTTQGLKASFAKAALNNLDPAKYPLSEDPKSPERVMLRFLRKHNQERQADAFNKMKSSLADEEIRKKNFGGFAEPMILSRSEGIAESWTAHQIFTNLINMPPIADSIAINIKMNQKKFFKLSGHDPEKGPVTFQLVSNPSHGEFKWSGGMVGQQWVMYAPDHNYYGTDKFKYTAKDETGKVSAPATVTINVEAPPPPVPKKDTVRFDFLQLKCVEVTDGSGADDITCCVMVFDDAGRRLTWLSPDEMQMDNGDTLNYTWGFNLDAREIEKDANGIVISKGWPKYYTMVVCLAEIDNGGFGEFLNDLWAAIDDNVKAAIGAGIGSVIGGSIGGIIGAVAGAIIGAIIGFIINLFDNPDDIFNPITDVCKMNGTLPVTSPDWDSGVWSYYWLQFDGHYTFNVRWRLMN